ncbi:beta-N-acetylhexosaminidase [Solihabitans fulvus]|uniref:beta-N-acetylhexosaminidase n=1 Tax=Solihabitans fulvus TaxID=1892852 RepID=A0A5B2XF97_9PSEU|nr:beta-N-acetylhexosaminidase [Solihabitans fulvus]KAA2262447.1 beta-N-acetylhexosaminidase [Solihabitans fulvus]
MTSFDALLPRPVELRPADGLLSLDAGTTLDADDADDAAEPAAAWLRGALRAATGLPLRPAGAESTIRFATVATVTEPEGYRLRVDADGVLVEAADPAGAFYAAQTIRQLLGAPAFRTGAVHSGPWRLPFGEIVDHPRFGWRGGLLDVARHFMPKADVLRFVDLLAAHKLNVLHLHLTDDQGWRFEVRRYPKLTEVGAWRTESRAGHRTEGVFDGRPHGGYYTQDDLREIVAYAAERHVTVVPEIDLPGHMQAAIAAYPALGNTSAQLPVWTDWGINENVLNVADGTLEFLRHVFDELLEVFPGTVIGLGGDEVPTTQWRDNAVAARRMAELGATDPAELHGWIIRQIAEHLAAQGRTAYGWDEILDVGPLPAGAVVASWRGEEAGVAAVRAGHDVVMCPEKHVYLDYRQSELADEPIPVGRLLTVEDVYRYEPIPDGVTGAEPGRVLGAQANVWTEFLDSPRRVDYAAFPRLSAFAEVVWSRPEDRKPEEFLRRLAADHLPRLDALGVEYRPLAGPRPWQTRPGVPGFPRD